MYSHRKKILVVDDEVVARTMLSKMLSHFSPKCQVIEVQDGLRALELLNKGETFDLIFLDVKMPIMDGFEVLTEIRKNLKVANIPVVMCTAVNNREEVIRILQQGVSGYIVKSNIESVALKVQKVLQKMGDLSNQPAVEALKHTRREDESALTQRANLPTGSVLIVDKEWGFRKAAGRIFSQHYNVIEAKNGEKALQLVTSEKPRIIMLGKVSGILSEEMTMRKLRETIKTEETKIYRVFPTAFSLLAEGESEGSSVEEKMDGGIIRTCESHLLKKRLRRVIQLPDFIISSQKAVLTVVLENFYPKENEECRILMWAVAKQISPSIETVYFNLSNWEADSDDTAQVAPSIEDSEEQDVVESSPKEKGEMESESTYSNERNEIFEVASRFLGEIIMKLRDFDINNVKVIGYTPPEGSSLASLLADS